MNMILTTVAKYKYDFMRLYNFKTESIGIKATKTNKLNIIISIIEIITTV